MESPMAALDIEQILVMSDNYIYLLHDSETGITAAVDPALSEPVLGWIEAMGWSLNYILVTHHHDDHIGGNLALKRATGCKIAGARADAERIPGLDIPLADGDIFTLGNSSAKVISTPGHTRAHLSYWFEESKALFCGDTLFSLGCGRLFEGTPEQMWASLSSLRALSDDTRVFCAHEYTQSNARYAVTIETGNQALLARSAAIDAARARGEPTVPSLLGEEKATNPFLRVDVPAVQAAVGLAGGDPTAVFAEVRHRKDVFR